MKKLNAGIIGCGNFGKLHSKIIKVLDNFKIAAYSDIDMERAKECFQQFGAGYYCDDYRRIINDRDIETVFICTTHDMHYPIAVDAIRAKKHIFMEKPMAMTVEQCENIENELKGKDIIFMVGHKMRYNPLVKKVKEDIKKPLMIIAQMVDNCWADKIWQQDPVKGGGNVLSQGCHIFNLITHLAGSTPDTVYAEGGTITHNDTKVIDNIVATVRYKNGVIASVTIGDSGVNGFTSKTMVQVFAGDVCYNLSENLHKYKKYEKGKEIGNIEMIKDYMVEKMDSQGFFAEHKDFLKCIEKKTKPLVGVKEGKDAVKMVHAVFDAVRTGKVQKF